jgi:hypothetical protein
VILAEGHTVGVGELGLDPVACRSGLDDSDARGLALRLCAGEIEELARFLGIPQTALRERG